jgi:ribosome-associated protein
LKPSSSLKFARLAARLADDKLGQEIVIIDVRGQTIITDYFVFVGAHSHLHVKALEDEIRVGMIQAGARLIRTDGQRGHLWRVLDYGSVIIHLMEEKTRDFYAIERLWDQGAKISFKEKHEAAKAPRKRKRASSKKKTK